MEGKTVILSVLIMSLVMTQIQVEAKKKSCCPTTLSRNCYNTCRLTNSSQEFCAKLCGCTLVDGPKCPTGSNMGEILENSGDGKDGYCKLGCASSVCDAMVTLLKNYGNGIMNEAVENCAKACSSICTKGFETAVEAA